MKTTDVLLPTIESCRKCHAQSATPSGSSASFDCILCHSFHHKLPTSIEGGKAIDQVRQGHPLPRLVVAVHAEVNPGKHDLAITDLDQLPRPGHGLFTYQAGAPPADSRVIDSREFEDGQAIRRRRSCPECSRRFTTVEGSLLSVVKRSGVTEPFSRSKVIAGVSRACQGRSVDPDAVAQLAQQVEESVRGSGQAEVPSQEVGLAILGPLRELDEVAYLRFASVYRSFTSAEDFAAEIRAMRSSGDAAAADSIGSPLGTGDPPAADRSPPVGVG